MNPIDALAFLLESERNRRNLFNRYYGEAIASIVVALKNSGNKVWEEVDREARLKYGLSSDYVTEFNRINQGSR